MEIRSKISEAGYINLVFTLTYRKLYMKILTALATVVLVSTVLSPIFLDFKFAAPQLVFPFVVLGFIPFFTYWSARKTYKANSRISEMITYRFQPETVEVVGESFNSSFTWAKVYKVTISKKWLLIWQSAQIASPISKRDLSDADLKDLRVILDKNKVKNNV